MAIQPTRQAITQRDHPPVTTRPISLCGDQRTESCAERVHARCLRSSPCFVTTKGSAAAVQLAGYWRCQDAVSYPQRGMVGIGYRDLVARAPAPDRRPAMLQRTLEAAAGMIAPVLADAAVTSARRLLQSRNHWLPVASLGRQLAPAARELPRSDRTP